MLPPLMFSEEEIEALVLGMRWVARRTDKRLGEAARDALMKIAAVLPPELRNALDSSGLLVGSLQLQRSNITLRSGHHLTFASGMRNLFNIGLKQSGGERFSG
ncbi:hypothetical protein IW01_14635 [Pectobacterium brasiliense]|nr:hypothetical protein IW01_14635 [Pectobacterium brasiliense]